MVKMIKVLLLLTAMASLVGCTSSFAQSSATMLSEANGKHDFDFLAGAKWNVTHRRLKERAVGSDEWIEFEAVSEFNEPFMDGFASIDVAVFDVGERHVEGVSLRVFNDKKNEWTIYWMDSVGQELTEQVRGRWEGNTGTFFGEEEHAGRAYKMRFLWTKVSDDYARWEQAYFIPEENDWETNWKMDIRRAQK